MKNHHKIFSFIQSETFCLGGNYKQYYNYLFYCFSIAVRGLANFFHTIAMHLQQIWSI